MEPLVGCRGVAATSWIFQIAQPPWPLTEGVKGWAAQRVSRTSIMLQLSSLITAEDEGPVPLIMALWCLLIHDSIVFDRQPKIKANKGLRDWGLDNFVGLRTKKKKVSK